MKRKKNWILMGVLSVVLLLQGCDGGGFQGKINIGDPVETPTAAPMATEAPAATEAPVETAEPLKTEGAEVVLPFSGTKELAFSSGAGGWATILELEKDGTFRGDFHDSEMGVSGEGYVASYYTCKFTGRFENIRKINDYTYKMTLAGYETEEPEGKEWIEDEVRYIAWGPYGIEDGKEFIFYTPAFPILEADDEFLSWWPFNFSPEKKNAETISMYAVYNVNTGEAFFGE